MSAYDHGYRCILLGADIPLAELPRAVGQSAASGIVLSASIISDLETFEEELASLVQSTPVPVFVGGLGSLMYKNTIEKTGAKALGTDFDLSFRLIAESIAPAGQIEQNA